MKLKSAGCVEQRRTAGRTAAPRASLHGAAGAGRATAASPAIARSAGHATTAARETPEHLGPYAALIGAIREELEHFVASQLRLHLAIAERDRYVLDVDRGASASEADEHRELLRRFMRRVQARADQALSRAGSDRRLAQRERDRPVAVRRPQCGARTPKPPSRTTTTRELLAELRSGRRARSARPYRGDRCVGRWSQADVAPARPAQRVRPAKARLAGDGADAARRPALRARHRGRRRRPPRRARVGRAGPSLRRRQGRRLRHRGRRRATPADGTARSGSTTAPGGWPMPASTNGIRVEVDGSGRRAHLTRSATAVPRSRSSCRPVRGSCCRRTPRARPAKYPRLALRRSTSRIPRERPCESPPTPATPIAPARRRACER